MIIIAARNTAHAPTVPLVRKTRAEIDRSMRCVKLLLLPDP